MAKVAVLAAVFGVLLLVANVYAYRTVITTIEIDEDGINKSSSEKKCKEQIEKHDLSDCERFITQSSRGIKITVSDGTSEETSSQPLQECCTQINRLDDKCQCRALKEIVSEGQQQRGRMQGQGQGQQQMMQRAQTVVTYCRLPQKCEWRSVWF